jgi:hypothetical protein
MGGAWDRASEVKWIVCGEVQIRERGNRRDLSYWSLNAYLIDGATDFEHSSAYAVCLPLVALQFDGTEYHETLLHAMVDPGRLDDFHVPLPGYNPLEHPRTEKCPDCTKKKGCTPHLIVPEGFYVPPREPKLFELVKGRIVSISIGPTREEEQD